MLAEVRKYQIEQWHHRHAVANGKIRYIKDQVPNDVTVHIIYRDDEESLLIHFIKDDMVARTKVGVEDAKWKMDITITELLREII